MAILFFIVHFVKYQVGLSLADKEVTHLRAAQSAWAE